MRESYGEGLATYAGPESCGAAREGRAEALTGGRAGRVSSRESTNTPGRRRCRRKRKATSGASIREMPRSPARSKTPCTYGSTSRENREIPCPPAADGAAGRIEKSTDVRR
jgi:hypothetical protein